VIRHADRGKRKNPGYPEALAGTAAWKYAVRELSGMRKADRRTKKWQK
jgi:hypothetical protein